ncbi:MAG: nucleotidyltransferase family protein, partial [Roseiarcus sp.]
MNSLPLPDRARWLLEACLRDDGRAVEAFGKWRRFADPDRMEGRELRLTPLLHANMRRLGLSDQKLAWIGGQAKHIWLTGVLRRRKLLPVLDVLEGAGVDFVLIKGAALTARFPKAVGTRPMGDFDLLIRRSSARAAMAILNASGWRGAIGAAFSDADLNRYHAMG